MLKLNNVIFIKNKAFQMDSQFIDYYDLHYNDSEVPKIVCPTNVDHRGTEWREVLEGTIRVQHCQSGFEGRLAISVK
jgi:hypothetical protein